MVSLYSAPDRDLLAKSSNTLWSCRYQGANALRIIDVKDIKAVVAMIPHKQPELAGRVFVVEKLTVDVLEATENPAEDDDI